MEENTSRAHKAVTIGSTVLMGLIAIATAWSGFQATKWGGEMSNSYAAANVARSNSVLYSLTANQENLLDIQLFIEWLNALAGNQTQLSNFYLNRMRLEARPAMEAWLKADPINNPDAPSSPFVMPEYVLQNREKAIAFEEKAVSLSEHALQANQTGDNYIMTTVILASGLFFSGVATRLGWRTLELVVLGIAVAAFGYGIYQIIIYPVLV